MVIVATAIDHLEIFVRHYMPSGKAWDAKNKIGSNIRNLASGFTEEFARGDLTQHNFIQEMMPDTTDEYVGDWEKAVGIPDHCFTVAPDLETRRLNIKTKLSLLGLQTKADFEGFATSIGLSIKARSGIDHATIADGGYETELPVVDIPTEMATIKAARQTLVITTLIAPESFTYEFDFPFSSPAQTLLECVFRDAKPANCNILFKNL